MFPLIHPATDPDQGVRSDIPGPALEASGRPLLLFLMAGGHVPWLGGDAVLMAAWVTGDQLLPEVDLHQSLTGMEVYLLADILVRHRVIMALELNVVVDVDPATPDLDVLIGVFG